ncbi:MAG TPA: hypothetical protein VLI90_10115 [Tepidisphaeraceae bacterium]|nr:hypothetical protein [Tepidisphaeraceae bacterium]
MKPKDWFVVGVRLIGVWWLVQALQELIYLICFELKYTTSSLYTPGTFVVHAVANLLIGLFLVSGAKLLVSFAGEWGNSD